MMILTIGVFVFDVLRRMVLGWGDRLLWLLVVIVLGPLGLILYWFTIRNLLISPDPLPSTRNWPRLLIIAVISMTTLSAGLFLGDHLYDVIPTPDFRFRLVLLYLTTLVISRCLSYLARRTYRISLLTQILVVNVFWVVVMLFPPVLRQFFNPSTWMLYPVETLIGIAITTLFLAFEVQTGILVFTGGSWSPYASRCTAKVVPDIWTVGLLLYPGVWECPVDAQACDGIALDNRDPHSSRNLYIASWHDAGLPFLDRYPGCCLYL
jgi:hypothetical protein